MCCTCAGILEKTNSAKITYPWILCISYFVLRDHTSLHLYLQDAVYYQMKRVSRLFFSSLWKYSNTFFEILVTITSVDSLENRVPE